MADIWVNNRVSSYVPAGLNGEEYAWEKAREAIISLCKEAPDIAELWTIQGLGMLRLHLSEDKKVRLHLWDKEAVYTPKPSVLHTHPWHFNSLTIAGRLTNVKFLESENDWGTHEFMSQEIVRGPNGCAKGKPKLTSLAQGSTQYLTARDEYSMTADEIHYTEFMDGSVSIITRTFMSGTETARVFWHVGQEWVSAEPRQATADEVARACEKALRKLGAK